jgi:hypothetical protein
MKVAKKRQHSFVSSAKATTKGRKETMTEKKPKLGTAFTEEKGTSAFSLIPDGHENWNFGGKTWEVSILQLIS